jgi:hypothetical protein
MDTNLDNFSLDDVIKWRKSASNKISQYDSEIEILSKIVTKTITKINKIKKKRQSSVDWVRLLKRNLHKRVFK